MSAGVLEGEAAVLRHGLSVHNMVMANVKGDAWKVRGGPLECRILVSNGALHVSNCRSRATGLA